MIRNSLSICALATTAFLSACGGGGGGGSGGGGGTATIDTPVNISGANFARVASLAVRSNLIVADSPNYNEGYPAAVVASAPLPSVNVMNLSRMQLVEINKVKPSEMVSAEAPIGAAPVNSTTDCGAPGDGTKTKTYIDSNNELTTREVGNKLTIFYSGCKLVLQQEAQNCVLISAPNKIVTLNGTVETEITEVTSPTVYKSQLTYTNLNVTTTRGATIINGKLLISLADGSPKITLTSVSGSPLTQAGGGVTERLRNATIQYDDNQQGCDPNLANNNSYTILATTTAEVASSDLGFVTVSVTTPLTGDSDSPGGGFPEVGSIKIASDGGSKMIITAAGNSKANVEVNGTPIRCTPTWLQIFEGALPAGCQ